MISGLERCYRETRQREKGLFSVGSGERSFQCINGAYKQDQDQNFQLVFFKIKMIVIGQGGILLKEKRGDRSYEEILYHESSEALE